MAFFAKQTQNNGYESSLNFPKHPHPPAPSASPAPQGAQGVGGPEWLEQAGEGREIPQSTRGAGRIG